MDETMYQQLLTDLEQERENIERMITWVKSRLEQPDSIQTNGTSVKPSTIMRFPRLAPDTFFRMKVPDAIKKYLNIVKRPQTAKDITAALDSGGLTHQSKNLYATVYPTLLRMEEAKEVVRVGRVSVKGIMKGQWGLSEWYPSGRKMDQGEKPETEA